MTSILNLAFKDLKQIVRDRNTLLFLLIMPIAFTFMFGLVFSGSSSTAKDSRLVVGIFNQDGNSTAGQQLTSMLNDSLIIRPVLFQQEATLQSQLSGKKIAASLVIPAGFGDSLSTSQLVKLVVTADPNTSDGSNAQTEIGAIVSRLSNAAQTAKVLAPNGSSEYDTILLSSLSAWKNPPVKLTVTEGIKQTSTDNQATLSVSKYAHSSPGMILQFAIAGLSTSAAIIIAERKNRCLQRLLTTATNRIEILIGHYIAIFTIILTQFAILITFGDLVLKVAYFSQPLATLVVAFTSAMCISALGLLIGVLIKKEEQSTSFTLICMFLLSGLGGAWVPLEVTGKTFQTIGHITPVAWAMDGFSNIVSRGLGIESVWLPAAALLGYAVLFLLLANWKFRTE